MQLAIRIEKNHAFRTCTVPLQTCRPILRSIGMLDIEIPRKEIISTDDRQTDGQTTIGSFFEKKKKLLKDCKLHKFATTNSIFKHLLFQTCIIVKRICITIFSKIGLVDQLKPCTQIYLQKFLICINLQLAIRIFKKSRLLNMHYTLTDIQADFEINRPVRCRNTTKRNYFHRRQTYRRITIGSFFEKR